MRGPLPDRRLTLGQALSQYSLCLATLYEMTALMQEWSTLFYLKIVPGAFGAGFAMIFP